MTSLYRQPGPPFWLTIKFPSGEEPDVRIARVQLLDQLDVEADDFSR